MTEKIINIEQKRKDKISQLKTRLQKEEALLKQDYKKERNRQLVVFGVLVEELFKGASEEEQERWIEKAKQYLHDRNLTRALAGFSRLQKKKS